MDEEELVRRTAAGDRRAFDELYRRTSPWLAVRSRSWFLPLGWTLPAVMFPYPGSTVAGQRWKRGGAVRWRSQTGCVSRAAPSTVHDVSHTYPPLNVEIRTPRVTLAGASDQLLERLVPLVRAGIADTEPWPFDDPMSLYADSPEREWRWLRGIWTGRGRVTPDAWRLYFVVRHDGEPVGMQDLIGRDFSRFGTVSSFSWLAPGARGRGLGREMRAAILHLAFAGFGASEAGSDAFVDNEASNRISRALGYEPNGTDRDTRRGKPALIQRWRLTRETWEKTRRADIELTAVKECLPVLGLA